MPKILTPDEVLRFRDRMCDHALATFAKHGVEGITLRGLAADLSCSRTTPYRYFKDKADILAALRKREFGRLADAQEATLKQETEPRKQLVALASTYLQFAIKEPDTYRVMYQVVQQNPSQYTELATEILRSGEPIRRVVQASVSAGIMHGDPTNIGYMLWAGLHGLIALHLADLLGDEREIEELATVMIRSLGRAVSTEPSKTAAARRTSKKL
ncbi:MAG: TetR-like C-terminal domain-containing protein [Pseudomonadales bacterium]